MGSCFPRCPKARHLGQPSFVGVLASSGIRLGHPPELSMFVLSHPFRKQRGKGGPVALCKRPVTEDAPRAEPYQPNRGGKKNRVADAHAQHAADQWLGSKGVNAVNQRPAGGQTQDMDRALYGLSRKKRDQNEEDRVDGQHRTHRGPTPLGRRKHDAHAEHECDGSCDPWTRRPAAGPATSPRRNQECRNHQQHAQHCCS